MIKDYGPAVLLVPYFMRRPYNAMLIVKDTTKGHLCECDDAELSALAQGWGEMTAAIMAFMPAMGRPRETAMYTGTASSDTQRAMT